MLSLYLPTVLSIFSYYATILPHVTCSSNELAVKSYKSISDNINDKLSPKMKSVIALHGILLWASMGLLAPLGILVIRMQYYREESGARRKALFYVHLVLQMLSVLLATAGAVMSVRSFENSFNNNHQRVGLALYCAIWVQAVIGFLRPRRGSNRRSTWYIVHWMLGTIITLIGIINIYTGLNAYSRKLSRSTRFWTILFTAQVSFMAFFYLFQDKWEYMQKQGATLGQHEIENVPSGNPIVNNSQRNNNRKVLIPEQCGKRNALRNLFD